MGKDREEIGQSRERTGRMSTLVALGSATAAKRALERLTEDIYELAKKELGKQYRQWRTARGIDTLYTKIKNVRNVKTVLQPEKAVDLLTFYYPTKVKLEKVRKTVNDVSDLGLEKRIVIQGTVGQGKSIFLRYLTSREMIKGEAIPLFAELRRVRKNETLIEHLVTEAQTLGLKDIDRKTLEWLAEKGKLILFLDAFDEIPENKRSEILTEIEQSAKTHDCLRIVVSSRPNSGVETSPLFRVVEISPIKGDEYQEAIRMMADESIAENIIKAIRSSRTPVRELLTTPLMVALLVVRHRIEQTIPENVIGFYQGLFGLLISRHDRMKGGYVRSRKSGLGDTALEEVFEAICFLTRKEPKGVFARREISSYAKQAGKLMGHKFNPDNLIADIVDITCLVIEEGDECRFIHRGVQEYYAASFIKGQLDETSKKFYGHALKNWSNWLAELRFLSVVDKYRFLKWFLIPDISEFLDLKNGYPQRNWRPGREAIVSALERFTIGIRKTDGHLHSLVWGVDYSYSFYTQIVSREHEGLFSIDCSDVLKEIEKKDSILYKKDKTASHKQLGNAYQIGFVDLLDSGLMNEEMRNWAEKALMKAYSDFVKANEYIDEIEARKSIFEM
jgi:hypothetical protein